MPSWKDFLEQLAVIKQAWIPFTLAVGVAFVLIYAAENWAFTSVIANKDAVIANRDSTIQTLEERVKLRDDQLNDKIKSTPPDEAKALIEKLQKRIDEISPRHIANDQKIKMEDVLKTYKGSVIVSYDTACSICQALENDFRKIFTEAGWNAGGGIVMGPGRLPKDGIVLMALPNSVAGNRIAAAFKAANIPFERGDSMPLSGAEATVVLTNPQ